MYEGSLVGITTDQTSTAVNRIIRDCLIKQVACEQIKGKKGVEINGL